MAEVMTFSRTEDAIEHIRMFAGALLRDEIEAMALRQADEVARRAIQAVTVALRAALTSRDLDGARDVVSRVGLESLFVCLRRRALLADTSDLLLECVRSTPVAELLAGPMAATLLEGLSSPPEEVRKLTLEALRTACVDESSAVAILRAPIFLSAMSAGLADRSTAVGAAAADLVVAITRLPGSANVLFAEPATVATLVRLRDESATVEGRVDSLLVRIARLGETQVAHIARHFAPNPADLEAADPLILLSRIAVLSEVVFGCVSLYAASLTPFISGPKKAHSVGYWMPVAYLHASSSLLN